MSFPRLKLSRSHVASHMFKTVFRLCVQNACSCNWHWRLNQINIWPIRNSDLVTLGCHPKSLNFLSNKQKLTLSKTTSLQIRKWILSKDSKEKWKFPFLFLFSLVVGENRSFRSQHSSQCFVKLNSNPAVSSKWQVLVMRQWSLNKLEEIHRGSVEMEVKENQWLPCLVVKYQRKKKHF